MVFLKLREQVGSSEAPAALPCPSLSAATFIGRRVRPASSGEGDKREKGRGEEERGTMAAAGKGRWDCRVPFTLNGLQAWRGRGV